MSLSATTPTVTLSEALPVDREKEKDSKEFDPIPPAISLDINEEKVFNRREWTLFWTLSFSLFLIGWNDGSIGPLLPRIQTYYGLNYTIVSMIFIAATVGFLSGATLGVYLNKRIGSGNVLAFGSILSIAAFAIQAAAPPFPVFAIASTINGIGISLQDAQANAIVASLQKKATMKMGILHAVYGFGALLSPLVATQFAQMPRRWSFHFLTGVGISILNAVLLMVVVRFRKIDDILLRIGIQPQPQTNSSSASTVPKRNVYKRIFSIPAVHLMTALLFVYVGIEVTLGGWIVTFLIKKRGAGPSAGYAASGFFGGLALGRLVLIWPTSKLGPRPAMVLYSGLCIGLQFVVWFVPNIVADATAESFVGFFLGPMYPMVMQQAGQLLPRDLLAGAIGWIAGMGATSGSAIFPFMTGAIANSKGIIVLQPIAISMMILMIIIWALIPAGRKQVEDPETATAGAASE